MSDAGQQKDIIINIIVSGAPQWGEGVCFRLPCGWSLRSQSGYTEARLWPAGPGARGANKNAVKRVLRKVWKKSEGETLRFVWNRSLLFATAVHMLPLSHT